MIMKKIKVRWIVVLILMVGLIFSSISQVFAETNESYDYKFIESEIEYGDNDGKDRTAVMKVKDVTGNTYSVYCIDKSVVTKNGSMYSLVNLDDANYYSKSNANKIRNIVLNSYPYITIEKIRLLSGIKDLSIKQAIAGTQAAIWNYSNETSSTSLSGNAKTLFNWYIKLPEKIATSSKIANIDIKSETKMVNENYETTIYYKASEKNVDESEVNLEYKLNKELSNATIMKLDKNSDGYNVIKINGLDKGTKFTITFSGIQTLGYDAYFYSPKEGKAQSLVGIRDDKTAISASKNIDVKTLGYTLTLNKIDSQSLNGIANAEFKIASDSEFKNNVVDVKTDENGKAKIEGLTTGEWYIKETKAPVGYIPNSEVMKIYINKVNISLDIKNSKYGSLKVVKVDENENVISGAKFILYKESAIESNLIKGDLISDSNGVIIMQDLLPGKYVLKEIETPDDYILNSELISFEVECYKTTTIKHINETKGYGKILIYKKDAVTKEQLGGTKVGIYSDPEFKNLIMEITTKQDEAVEVSNLRPGTYYIKELEAPKGYLLDSEPQKIEVEKDKTVEVTFLNSKNYSTAGNYATMMFAGVGIIAIGMCALTARKIYNRRRNVKEN